MPNYRSSGTLGFETHSRDLYRIRVHLRVYVVIFNEMNIFLGHLDLFAESSVAKSQDCGKKPLESGENTGENLTYRTIPER